MGRFSHKSYKLKQIIVGKANNCYHSHALCRYRRNRKFVYLFKGSETTERFTKFINDVFELMNGSCIVQGINVTNWWKIKTNLDIFLDILDITEECKRKKKQNDPYTPVKMFLSDTT
jgi:hypothetical protein